MKAVQINRLRGIIERIELIDDLYGITRAEREALDAMRGKIAQKMQDDE